jgi:hypothetical protein
MLKPKSTADLDREIKTHLVKRVRYMLVDARTGKDMREALPAEVAHIQKTANRLGISTLRLGRPDRTCAVKIRSMRIQL